jgi:hypothetical protein
MKLWELFSVLRSEPEILKKVTKGVRWKQFESLCLDFDDHVQKQNRLVLDAEMPEEFCREALGMSSLVFCLRQDGHLELLREDVHGGRLTALEAYEQFGGDSLEEALEYGCVQVVAKGP